MQSDCIVVGGGLIGLFCARELGRAGQRVLLLERGQLGREASWAGAGVLAALEPRTTPPALQALLSYSQERYADVARDSSGRDRDRSRMGTLRPPFGRSGCGGTGHCLDYDGDTSGSPGCRVPRGARTGVVDPRAGLARPRGRPDRNPRLLRALRGALAAAGVAVREHCEVRALRHTKGRILGVETAGDRIAPGP